MANSFFQFKQFTIQQDKCAMKVTTDACLFGSITPTLVPEEKMLNVLDIGTGTGLLSLMFAQQKANAVIDAIEIDENAAVQAEANIKTSPWSNRVNVIHGDAKKWKPGKLYEIIISNPPFYEKDLKGADTQKNKAHHNDGLILTELLKIITASLAPDGRFYLLFPYKRKEEAENLFTKEALTIIRTILLRQTAVHDYFRVILEGKRKSSTNATNNCSEISIRDEQDVYTPEFVNLLKDYYLYL